jgi:hypothetical protein
MRGSEEREVVKDARVEDMGRIRRVRAVVDLAEVKEGREK